MKWDMLLDVSEHKIWILCNDLGYPYGITLSRIKDGGSSIFRFGRTEDKVRQNITEKQFNFYFDNPDLVFMEHLL